MDNLSIVWKLRLEVGEVVKYLKKKDDPDFADKQQAFEDQVNAFLLATANPLKLDDILAIFAGLQSSFQQALALRDRSGLGDSARPISNMLIPSILPKQPTPWFSKSTFSSAFGKNSAGQSRKSTGRYASFLPQNSLPLAASNLGAALQSALLYLAHLKALNERVKLGKNSRLKLLALWSNLSTTGKNPLYAQLFLTRSVLKNDVVFDDLLGNYLSPTRIEQVAASTIFEAVVTNLQPIHQLDPTLFTQEPAIKEIAYDELLLTQRLSYQGVLSDDKKEQLLEIVASPSRARQRCSTTCNDRPRNSSCSKAIYLLSKALSI